MKKYIFLSVNIFILSFIGCKETQVKKDQMAFSPFKKPVTLSTTTEGVEQKSWEHEISTRKEVIDEKKEKIPDEIVYSAEYKKPEPSFLKQEYAGDKIDIAFNFDNAEIKDVLEVTLGQILNLNYILDSRVGGKISLHATGQVYKEELFTMLNTVLNVYNFAIVKDGDIYRVLSKPDARQEANLIIVGDKIPPWSKDIVIQIVPIQYENPKNLNATLRPFLTNIGNIVTHGDSQFIILIESASNMEKLLTLIKTFDVPFLAGKAIRFYEFKNVDARNVAKDLATLAQSLGGKVGPDGEFNFVPFSDTNKMLVITRTPELLPKVDLWIKNIDVLPVLLDEVPNVYVYKVQHQKAETIVPVLTQIYSEKMTAPPKVVGKEQVEAMKIVADPKTNAIVIKALKNDYKCLKAIIETIDATPPQVFIEVLIIEVGLNSGLDYGTGLRWADGVTTGSSTTKNIGISALPVNPANLLGPNLHINKGNFEVLLDILATNTDTRVLSAPHILVRDEQPASIQVGSQVPVLSSSGQSTGTTAIFEQVQYRDTGIILTVTPHIAENDFITLDIKQEVSDVFSTQTGEIKSPTFSTRKAETSLVIKSAHTISLGGIIEQKDEKNVRKVPLLGDIPYLGNLFKTTSITNKRTELVMLITPYIASTAEDADILTDAFQKKLKQIEPLLTQKTDEIEKK
ncbi:MAG: type II secretion system secretin GspD [Candidatus Brocadiaceae bacterium]